MHLIKVYAKWCGGCKVIAPVLKSIAEKHSIEIEEIDAEEIVKTEEGITRMDKLPPIKNLPTVFVVDDNGDVIETLVGVKRENDYLTALKLN